MGYSDGSLKSKAKTIDKVVKSAKDLEPWNTSSTDSDGKSWILSPVAIFRDPFRGYPNILVLCDCYKEDGKTPIEKNNRNRLHKAVEKASCEPWFGFEQEYTLYSMDGHVFGWPGQIRHKPVDQGPSYCGVGASFIYGRFMMERLGEMLQLFISLSPKPESGYAGAGGHMNFSTKEMREDGGLEYIHKAMDKLKKKRNEHIKNYGEGNEERLNGSESSSSMEQCSCGVENRNCSIRITKDTQLAKKGYLEDRRPGANCDPYLVATLMIETCCLD